ncbi:MAG: SurA N-terminal domain-containing protein [Deltaproteobacteria bacterium]|nr:SurA N-terminal domain-containing protein [Deltaproteobacteria bacterium]MBW2019040.1 SurA N-terminal domain-containing protein [Deltaproteobacteria bacterium]MBW2073800.1 SurA N-terminal domain-containing protein [Deltaproteobacteria bacterium]RLB82949.1 MAG: hypothetical protein DRH17_04120 [Deltaproteobacteria bacterium]
MKKSFVFAFLILFWMTIAGIDVPHCASGDTLVVAEVNGETIDERAIQDRIRAIHRYRPPIRPEGGAGNIEILDLVEQMIDERLMIQEAYRMELDRSADFAKQMASYITSQSVVRLKKEEVLDKIKISEEDLLDYFKKHYEKEGPAPEGEFEKRKKGIRKKLRKEKEKALSDQFISKLRQEADIWIDKKLVDLIDPEKDYAGKKSVIARVNGQPISLDDMLHDMKQAFQRRSRFFRRLKSDGEQEKMLKGLKQQVLDALIRYKLVEQEALKRNYVADPAFMDMVKKRKNWLLINEFKAKIIYPLAIPTKKELTKYYKEHINDFRKSYEVWCSEMIFRAREDAEKTLKELKQGADFEFLAARVSESTPRRARIWVNTEWFSPPIRKVLNRLKAGEISDVIADGRQYKIIKLKGKRGGEPEEFSNVVGRLKQIVAQEKFDAVLSDYLARLRKESRIKINEKALKMLEKKYTTGAPSQVETTDPTD